jgi:hypothetical protein
MTKREQIIELKKYVNPIPATEMNEYNLIVERCIAYNQAIDDILALDAETESKGAEITDEDIRKWANEIIEEYTFYERANLLEIGAKAIRDGKIPSK